jgi:general secretion pathway protein C
MMQRRFALPILGVVAASATAWALYAFVQMRSTALQTKVTELTGATGGEQMRPLGIDLPPGASTPTSASAPMRTGERFKLVGVATSGGEGIALISVNGQPARAIRSGATVEGNIFLQQVTAAGAVLGSREGGAAMTTFMIALAPAAGGTAPVATAGSELVPQSPGERPNLSPEVLLKLGSKHPPVSAPALSAPNKSVDGTAGSADGRWTPQSRP